MTRTAIMFCCDSRLKDRGDELFQYYQKLDDDAPFRVLNPGCSLAYQTEGYIRMALIALVVEGGVTHVHIEDHMGANDTSGCAAFRYRHRLKRGDHVPYPASLEATEHHVSVDRAVHLIGQLTRRMLGQNPTITSGIYAHDQAGVGQLQLIRQDLLADGFGS